MKDFSNAVNTAMQAMIESGKVEEIIKAKLEKTVESAIDDALRSYSDFGKGLTKHIESSLKVDFSNCNLQEYGQTVLKMVEGLVNKHVQESAQAKLLDQLNQLFDTPPAQVTLQQLLDDYRESEEDEAQRDGHENCGFVIEKDEYGFVSVGFNPSDQKDDYSSYGSGKKRVEKVRDCEIQIHLNKKDKQEEVYELRWVSFGGHRAESTQNFMPTCLHRMARRLFQMYCAGTKITIDSLDSYDYEKAYRWVD